MRTYVYNLNLVYGKYQAVLLNIKYTEKKNNAVINNDFQRTFYPPPPTNKLTQNILYLQVSK